MKLYDGGKIFIGILVFVAFAAFPFYFNIGKVNAKPEPKVDTPAIQEWEKLNGKKECVESKEFMRAEHMQLLNDWRDSVVRRLQPRLHQQCKPQTVQHEPAERLHELPLQQEEVLRRMPYLYVGEAVLLGLPYSAEGEGGEKS